MPYPSPKPPPPHDTVRLAYSGTLGPTTWAVIHWFATAYNMPVAAADLDTVTGDFFTAFGDNFVHVSDMTNRLHLTRVDAVYHLSDGTVRRRRHVGDVSGNGASSGEEGQVAILINWDTGDPRRGGKPRSYIPGVAEDRVSDEASLTGGCVTSRTAACATYLTTTAAITTSTVTVVGMVDVSFVNANDYRPSAVQYEIFGGTCNPIVATQRRRVDRLRV